MNTELTVVAVSLGRCLKTCPCKHPDLCLVMSDGSRVKVKKQDVKEKYMNLIPVEKEKHILGWVRDKPVNP